MKFKTGELYYIRFLDHAMGNDVLPCEVCGWVLKEDEYSITITVWNLDIDDEEVKNANTEPIALIKSCILKKRKINLH